MIIRQRNDSDCGICCVAMLAGASYEQAIAAAGDHYQEGVGLHAAAPVLEKLGVAAHRIATITLGYDWAEGFKGLIGGKRALLSVPSVNEPDANHMVYWNVDRVVDPSPRVKQTDIQKIRPHRIVIVA